MRLDLGEGRVKGDAGRSETNFGLTASLRKSDDLAKPLCTKKKKGPHWGLVSGSRMVCGGGSQPSSQLSLVLTH